MLEIVDVILILLMVISAVVVLWICDLFVVVMLSGAYSLFAASLYVVLDAIDVAFTEAAVGAGISTVLMLGTLALTSRYEKTTKRFSLIGFLVVVLTGGLLIYGISDMPLFSDASAPIHHHVANRYIEQSSYEVGLPNVVTSVLASYRGYDTLGEVTVIFTAAVGVLALLGRTKRDVSRLITMPVLRERLRRKKMNKRKRYET